MGMLGNLHGFLSAGAEPRSTLFWLGSLCSTLLYVGMALIFCLEYYHFRLNKASMSDTVKKAGFDQETFAACMDSCMLMSGLSLFLLVLDSLASHACLWLSRRMRSGNEALKHLLIFIQYLAHCISICLLSVIKPSTSPAIDAAGSGFTSTLSFLIMSYFFYTITPYALASFTLGHELHNCLLAFYRVWFLDPRPVETVFTRSSYLSKEFADRVKEACSLLSIKAEDIYVVDDDSRDLVVSQSMFENTIRIPVRAIAFFQEEALLTEVLGKLFDLHNLSLVKAKLCMALIRLLIALACVLMMYLLYLEPTHDATLRVLGLQKITYILRFPGIVLLNCFLRRLERLSDEFVLSQGPRDNIARLFSKMSQNEEKVYNPYYTGIIGLLSPTSSFITRMERMSAPHE